MTKRLTKHLYIHIPFCKSICAYCDFVRYVKSSSCMYTYVNKIIKQIQLQYKLKQFKTIYVGGGTPNALPNDLLNKLLHTLSKYLDDKFEFTIECNPEFLTFEQAQILKQNKVNRTSIGVQTIKSALLHQLNRKHTLLDVTNAIKHLQKVGIHNISVDLLYGLNELTKRDVVKTINYLHHMHIPHVSWYALELKSNSILSKQGYLLDEIQAEEHLKIIIKHMSRYYERYEVSNWCINKTYQSAHNKAYWLSKDWAAVGLGGCGFENKQYYEIVGTLNSFKAKSKTLSKNDFYCQIMMMGLRLVSGLDLSIPLYYWAYLYFRKKLKNVYIKNKHLIAKDLNTLNYSLIDIV